MRIRAPQHPPGSIGDDTPNEAANPPTSCDESSAAPPEAAGGLEAARRPTTEGLSVHDRRSNPNEARPPSESAAPPAAVHVALEELDQISVELRRRPPSNGLLPTHETLAPGPSPRPKPQGDMPPVGYGVSPYLEERLGVAHASMSALGREVRSLGERWQQLKGTAEVLEREIGNAAREAMFLSSSGEPGGAPLVSPTDLTVQDLARSALARTRPSLSPRSGSVPYEGFTVARYNTTIGGLKARRRRLGWWTVVLAAAISAALVFLSVSAREPMPAIWWIAVLPAIWMIPVPFFVLSFFGTQRVLRRNHLDLPGIP